MGRKTKRKQASRATRDFATRMLACAGGWDWRRARLVTLSEDALRVLQERLDGAAWYASDAGQRADAALLRRLARRVFDARMSKLHALLVRLREAPLTERVEMDQAA